MNDYENLINSSPLVLIEFYATWCPHCQRMMPVIAQLRDLLGDAAQIYQLDIDQNDELAQELGVNSTPTFIIYRDGKPVWTQAGELDGNELLRQIQSFMA